MEEAEEFHCLPSFRERLGMAVENSWTKLFVNIFGRYKLSIWKGLLYGPRDKWWNYSENYDETLKNVKLAVEYFMKYGLAWFNEKNNIKMIEGEYIKIKKRVKISGNHCP